jgi:hypothetical protein
MILVRTTSSGVESSCATELAADPHSEDSRGLSLRPPMDDTHDRCRLSYT